MMRQSNQPIGYDAIITTELCLIATTGLTYAKRWQAQRMLTALFNTTARAISFAIAS